MSNLFAKYLSNSVQSVSLDTFYSDNLLFLPCDKNKPTRSLSIYSDLSIYKRNIILSPTDLGGVSVVDNLLDIDFLLRPVTQKINIGSFLYFDNFQINRNVDLGLVGYVLLSDYPFPAYLNGYNSGSNPINISGDFVFEVSFYLGAIFTRQSNLQVIFESGTPFGFAGNLVTFGGSGFALYVHNGSLKFIINSTIYIIPLALTVLNWYDICIIRDSGTLYVRINEELVLTTTSTVNTTLTYTNTTDHTLQQFYVGCAGHFRYSNSGVVLLTSFTGGLSNLRITDTNRYPLHLQRFNTKITFPTIYPDAKVDLLYDSVIFNYPFLYDVMDYSKYSTHFNEKTQWNTLLPETGGLRINEEFYDTEEGSLTFADDWCFEFYLGVSENFKPIYNDLDTLSNISGVILGVSYQTEQILMQIISNDFVVFEVGLRFWEILFSGIGYYLYFKYSDDGQNYVEFVDETLITSSIFGSYTYDDLSECKFFVQGGPNINFDRGLNPQVIRSFYKEPSLHFALQRLNGLLYVLINGVSIYSVAVPQNLYSDGTYKLRYGTTVYNPITTTNATQIDFLLKGVKLTNDARYTIVPNNDFLFNNSIQPLPLKLGAIEHQRFRVIDLLRSTISSYTDAQTVIWTVLTTQRTNNLSIQDFSLTSLEGISGASIISISEVTTNQHTVTVDTGSGNGRLILNFVDRKTLTYEGTNVLVSNFVGELSVSGQEYIVNKSAPEIILTSTSSPYVFGKFQVKLTVTNDISNFDQTKIAIQNGTISNFINPDIGVDNVFTFDVTPVAIGAIYIQILPGFVFTTSNISNLISQVFVRIYNISAVVLQLPLNLSTTLNDVSPSNLIFSEVVTGNSFYDETNPPDGESSSFLVNPILEQGGLHYDNFQITKLLDEINIDQNSIDYTFELFYKTGSITETHIISFVSDVTGFSLKSVGTNLILSNNYESNTNIITGMNITEPKNTYNHFYLTRKNGTYRVGYNGIRRAITRSINKQPFDCDVNIGYVEFLVNQEVLNISNIRIIAGLALYTDYAYDIPRLPYETPLQITDIAQILNFVTIFSDNNTSQKAIVGNTITLRFSSIANLSNITVDIANRTIAATSIGFNEFQASFLVDGTDVDGIVAFSINVPAQLGIAATAITRTTNNSFVIIDNAAFTSNLIVYSYDENKSIFDMYFSFSKTPINFTLNSISTINATVSNLLKLDDLNYKVTVRALTTGTIELKLLAGSVLDILGNPNLASNIFNRSIIVPTLVPDPYIDNVIFYLLGDSFIDISNNNVTVNNVNVNIDYEIAAPGITSSLSFNGSTSNLQFDIGESLSRMIPYTVELFVYSKGNVDFSLTPPMLNQPSNVTSTSFDLSWDSIPGATSYDVFVSTNPRFANNIQRYSTIISNIKIGNSENSLSLNSDYVASSDDFGFVIDKFNPDQTSVLDISIDENFQQYQTFITKNFYFGTVEDCQEFKIENLNIISEVIPNTTNSILHGLLGNFQTPFLYFLSQENTFRVYPTLNYILPAIHEDVELGNWYYIKMVNNPTKKKLELYVNDEYVDSCKYFDFNQNFILGYSLSHFFGNVAGVRITKGVARPNIFNPTVLPYGTIV